ncbi:GNAT family N-acetyltransferase [Devosia sp. XJ19-1]|uniref:GNAT family N-acetyltransferase n=1 Tax=Devosia ureilytica TaxID=2952754 RepID=A0A9Q4FSS0_9HYPH|nr:GNAT family N-acetyltransferase [Devosia ureilytica]MCP8883562.1 GNAT family N-acetyltransferase [Devosia ureilytica]MCP8887170.1 GNAT family N-acetyltransferase [Devosia ureilytica]
MSATVGMTLDQTQPLSRTADRVEAPTLVSRKVDGHEWDAVISGFDCICQEQLFAFASIRWPGVAPEPRLFERKGRIVGGALVMVQQLPLGLAQIAIVKWGPMLADVRATDAPAVYAGMVEALIAEYADQRGMMLSVLPHASVLDHNSEYQALRARGFKRGALLRFPDRYLVNLRLSDEAQRKSFDQTWRRQLNKADKSDLVFEHAGPERLDDFNTLYAAMSDRKQFADYSAFDTLDALMAMDEQLRPELFFVRHEGELVAGALIFKAGNRAVYLYGATNEKALPLRAGYFMHWHIIRWLRDHTRANWYDLGGTDGFQGLHQFKKGMVGDAGLIRPVPPVANYASRPLAYAFGAGAFAARELFGELRRRVEMLRPSRARADQAPSPVSAEFQ